MFSAGNNDVIVDQLDTPEEIHLRLIRFFGKPTWRVDLSPLDELVSTILSQNTNDRNRDQAFTTLKERFPTWEAVRDARPSEVIDSIRTAGLANQKGPRIQEILRQITSERGELNIDFLCDLSTEAARSWLLRFKGVGQKTAAIVLLFAFGKQAFPVDTHIYRVSSRLGLRPPNMNLEDTHFHLATLFKPDSYGVLHLNLIQLGREICHARKPNCERCPLSDICSFNKQN